MKQKCSRPSNGKMGCGITCCTIQVGGAAALVTVAAAAAAVGGLLVKRCHLLEHRST
jgi:hypothetical protein